MSRSTVTRRLPNVVGRFIRTESAGGVVLVVMATVAMVWANSPWRHGYDALWATRFLVEVGPVHLDDDLRHVVNDGLMALFFFVVGLEIKREVVRGELADVRVAALPVFAAIGGMLVPAAIYAAIVGGGPGADGWGIPVATDIAFALGALALLGSRVPASLSLFLLTLAIVDDLGAIAVIAVFYGGPIEVSALAVAAAGVASTYALRRARVGWRPVYVALALLTWYATYRSGVHATIAGVALALVTPATPLESSATARRWAHDLADQPTAAEVRQMQALARRSVSPAERLEDLLHSTTSFLVLPVFALANAGVSLTSVDLDRAEVRSVVAGVVVGLVVGKPVGILAGAVIATRLRIALLPNGLQWRHLGGGAALAGIGFTVSLFVAGLALDDAALVDAARVAVLGASVVAAAGGLAVSSWATRRRDVR